MKKLGRYKKISYLLGGSAIMVQFAIIVGLINHDKTFVVGILGLMSFPFYYLRATEKMKLYYKICLVMIISTLIYILYYYVCKLS